MKGQAESEAEKARQYRVQEALLFAYKLLFDKHITAHILLWISVWQENISAK